MVKAIISDMGQVVLWFDNRLFYRRLSAASGRSEEEIREAVRDHFELVELLDTGRITPQEFYAEIISATQAKLDYQDFFTAYVDVFTPNWPAINILRRARGSCRLVLLSNTDIVRFQYIQQRFPETMVFDSLVLSFEVGLMKPHPQIYQVALKAAGTAAEETVFIDDLEENVRTAASLGMATILYRPETNLEEALLSLGVNLLPSEGRSN